MSSEDMKEIIVNPLPENNGKTFKCPAAFQEFLGEKPRVKDILVIIPLTLILTGVIGYETYDPICKDQVWKYVVYLFMTFDIIAGALANFTKSTQKKYSNNDKSRIVFLGLHVIHMGLIYLGAGHLWYCVGILAYTLVGAYVVNCIRVLKDQEIMASTFMSCGFVIFYGVLDVPKVLLWVPAVLMNKLIMGFSIRREEYIK